MSGDVETTFVLLPNEEITSIKKNPLNSCFWTKHSRLPIKNLGRKKTEEEEVLCLLRPPRSTLSTSLAAFVHQDILEVLNCKYWRKCCP